MKLTRPVPRWTQSLLRNAYHSILRLTDRLAGFFSDMAVSLYENPFPAFAVIVVVTALALVAAGRLKLDTDLARLLPSSFESVKDLETLKNRYGGEGYLVVVGRDAEPDALRRFAEDITPKLSALPGVRYVENRRPTEFFKDHALYYMDLQDLETVRERIAKRYEWEVIHANPFYVDLLDTKPPSLDFSDIEKKYKNRAVTENLYGSKGSPYYIDEERKLIAVLIKPSGFASDIQFAQGLVKEVDSVIAGIDLRAYGPDLKAELTGRYKKRVDMQSQIRRDLGVASTAAQLLMLLYVVIHFRRKAAVFFVFIPLIVGLIWTFGFAGIAFKELNILTAFIGTILMGMGIDHGIHLLSSYEAECTRGRCNHEALYRTFTSVGRPVAVAALTTIVAFISLAVSQLKAFYQFGILAAVGLTLLLLAYSVCLPVLLGLAHRMKWKPKVVQPGQSSFGRLLSNRASGILVLFTLLLAVTSLGIARVSFNYDFAALDDANLQSYRLDGIVNEVMGHSQTPLIIPAPDRETEGKYATAVRDRIKAYGSRSLVDFVLSSHDLIPPDQQEKHAILQDIGRMLQKTDPMKLAPEQRNFLEDAKRMSRAEPFSVSSLPEEMLRKFQGVQGEGEGSFILIYPSIKLAQGDLVVKLAKELRDIPVGNGTTIRAFGEAMVMADILKVVFGEATPVLILTVVLVFLTMWLLLGSFGLAALCLCPALITLLATIGVWSCLGEQFNYMNLVVIPVLLGMGVDGGVHIMYHMRRGCRVNEAIALVGPPITGAILTTMLGFGAMVLAHHPGLKSLGELAVLGFTINLIVCVIGLPTLLTILGRYRPGYLFPLTGCPADPAAAMKQDATHCFEALTKPGAGS